MVALRSFINHLAEPMLLCQLLQAHKLAVDDDLLFGATTALSDAIKEKARESGNGKLAGLLADMERIVHLADEVGETALREATLIEGLSDLPSRHARALHVFLNDQPGFRRAEEIFYSDKRRRGRDWSAFGGTPERDPASDPQAIEDFRAALRIHFDTANVHIEIYERTRSGFPDDDDNDGRTALTQITIYTEDRPNAELAFQSDGGLGTQVRRRVVEAAITYERATGTIECVGRQRDSREEMARLVATTLLKSAPDFQPLPLTLYCLEPLRSRVDFAHDPQDPIEDVRVAMLRLAPLDASPERVTVETLSSSRDDIWYTIDQRLGRDALASNYVIDQVRLVIRYRAADSGRLRSLPITITPPHRSNLKDRASVEQLVAGKYLPRWGLVLPKA